MTNFDHDYLVMDEFGRKNLRCMACGKNVAARVEQLSEKFRGKTSFDFMKYADYREIPFWLKDGSVSFLIFCDECKNAEVGEEEMAKMTEQIRRAAIMVLKYSGKTDEFIESKMINFEQKSIARKMTGEEVREKFSDEFLESKVR